MNRRKFITVGLVTGIGAVCGGISSRNTIHNLVNRAYGYALPTVQPPSEADRISVEMALNSRCNSDSDGDSYHFHWGMFDSGKKLSGELIDRIIELARIPRFTDQKIEIRPDSNTLRFIVRQDLGKNPRDWLMVESGMQQQAVGLVCAALGLGMVFDNRGRDGIAISETEFETTKIKLGPMKPSYDGSFWTGGRPAGKSPWLAGNLPYPTTDGGMPLISALRESRIERKDSQESTEQSLSQLLWAARGRTPHFYKSKPWGMTIPRWRGEQHISSVYVIRDGELLRYINWKNNRPTHALSSIQKIDVNSLGSTRGPIAPEYGLIVVGKNEISNRALWEVGYQMLNLLVQGHSLGINYRAMLLDPTQKGSFAEAGVIDPVGVLLI
jgi:hypothetical protein